MSDLSSANPQAFLNLPVPPVTVSRDIVLPIFRAGDVNPLSFANGLRAQFRGVCQDIIDHSYGPKTEPQSIRNPIYIERRDGAIRVGNGHRVLGRLETERLSKRNLAAVDAPQQARDRPRCRVVAAEDVVHVHLENRRLSCRLGVDYSCHHGCHIHGCKHHCQ
nr:hypothetical protein BRARA_G00584 [Ipomoea batatas]